MQVDRRKKICTNFLYKDINRIREAISIFSVDPYFGDIRRLKGSENIWRRRVGNYRVIYQVDDDKELVSVLDIRRRTTKTYSNLLC